MAKKKKVASTISDWAAADAQAQRLLRLRNEREKLDAQEREEIEAIRAEWIERFGEPEPLSDFYDPLLTAGSLPPALVREILFQTP